ncbi:Protein of unknown function [Porphyromonas crevioricanis]|nr:Protein of unknown function [Porphyromonas crevioricanis]
MTTFGHNIYAYSIILMENFSQLAARIFDEAIMAYEAKGDIDATYPNPYPEQTIEHDLYRKNLIDNIQWHLEDIIRDPDIDPALALQIKRRIDRSNQDRTDLVELIDSYFLTKYRDVCPQADATINTESPAWAIDRLSILKLKIYNMRLATQRTDTSEETRKSCRQKLAVLMEQDIDLSGAIDQLLADIEAGRKYMKVYKQMKMYNDPNLNPVLLDKAKA